MRHHLPTNQNCIAATAFCRDTEQNNNTNLTHVMLETTDIYSLRTFSPESLEISEKGYIFAAQRRQFLTRIKKSFAANNCRVGEKLRQKIQEKR